MITTVFTCVFIINLSSISRQYNKMSFNSVLDIINIADCSLIDVKLNLISILNQNTLKGSGTHEAVGISCIFRIRREFSREDA